MASAPTMYTSPTQLDGTITGMIITVIVAALGLVILIGLVFWAANHPDIKPPHSREPVNSSKASRPGAVVHTTYEVVDAASNAGEVNESASRSV